MKKNWILFALICGTAYIWMFYTQAQERRDYDARVAKYKLELAAYEEYRAKQEETNRLLLETARAGSADRLTTEALARLATLAPQVAEAEVPSVSSADVRSLLRSVDLATSHTIETDLYRVVFSEFGGKPIEWQIKSSEYVSNPATTREGVEKQYVNLIPQLGDRFVREFPLELSGATARDFNNQIWSWESTESDNTIAVILRSPPVNNMTATKRLLFRKDSYVVDMDVVFENGPETRKRMGRDNLGFGIGWQGGFGDPDMHDRAHGAVTAVLASKGSIYTRSVSRETTSDEFRGAIDWAGQEKKFFAATIIPSIDNPVSVVRTSFDRARNDDVRYQQKGMNLPLSVDLFHEAREIAPGETITLKYQLYVGPKNLEALSSKALVPVAGTLALSHLLFHNIPLGLDSLRFLSIWMLRLMRWLHDTVGAWGWAIILTTVVVRIIIYPLTHWAIKNQARTMIEQQKIRPEMEQIRKKFKGDPMKQNQAIMQLYRDHGVNPLGFMRGCVPMLLQMPVFLALYVVFAESVELRGKSFLWMNDLSAPDALIHWGVALPLIGASFNLLPILMGITNFIQMKIMQMPAQDEMQQKIQTQMMYMMPIIFTFFLYHLPSGLILYWIVSNCISILQSLLTKRIIASHMAAHEAAQKTNGAGADKKMREEPART